MTDAENRIEAARELCAYFVDSPQGWVGEASEIAADILAVLNGEGHGWGSQIAEARAKGWVPSVVALQGTQES